MLFRCCIFLLLISINSPAISQTVQGCITDADSSKPLVFVDVINVSTSQITHTDQYGNYSIYARSGDMIRYSSIGYKAVQKTVPPSILFATVNISMEPAGYQLKEFSIKSNNLTKYQIDSTERAIIYKLPLARTHPSPIMSPASAIAEQFSKKAKNIYKFQEVFAAGEIEKFTDTRYTTQLVTQLTGITGDSIGYFMYAYPMPYDFARTATDLEIKIWIRDNYKAWIKKLQ